MALSDYDTAAEKISALKAAMIDPALMNLETGTLNVSEDIYLVTWAAQLNSLYLMACPSYNYIMPKISSGDVLIANDALLYVKDSDIVYSDPITTYQDRLVKISESNMKIVNGNGFTAGVNGCLILTTDGATNLRVNTKTVVYNASDAQGKPLYVPTQSGWVINTYSTNDEIVYIDLPSDW